MVIDGWNSMNAAFLNHSHISEALPVIKEKLKDNKLSNDDDKGSGVYLNVDLDNSTSASAIYKTLMTGNLPGLIEIPKQMYFNSSKSEK